MQRGFPGHWPFGPCIGHGIGKPASLQVCGWHIPSGHCTNLSFFGHVVSENANIVNETIETQASSIWFIYWYKYLLIRHVFVTYLSAQIHVLSTRNKNEGTFVPSDFLTTREYLNWDQTNVMLSQFIDCYINWCTVDQHKRHKVT